MTRRVLPAVVIALTACGSAPADDPRMVAEWMRTLYGMIRTERISPPVASRFMGYASVALHEGLAAADPKLESAAGTLNGLTTVPAGEPGQHYDGTLTAVAAERVVLDSLLSEALPTTRGTLDGLVDSLRATRTTLGVDSQTAARSGELGRRIGLHIVAWSRADGFDSTRGRPYSAPVGDPYWINDNPASNFAAQNLSGATDFVGLDNPANNTRGGSASDRGMIMNRPKPTGLKGLPPVNMSGANEPYWGWVRPFVLKTWDECPIAEPPPYSIDTASVRYKDAKQVYDVQKALTPEQKAIALYWADNPGESGTPSGHWVSIASQMIGQQKLSAGDAARLFVRTAVPADAFISAWGYKYRYSIIRPRTYIRRVIDPAWEPLIPTPPFPEYPAGHATQSVAAAQAIISMLGDLPFEDSTGLALGPGVRKYQSFSQAALEAGESRIYGGIHFETGNAAGRAVGACIGRKTAERLGTGTPK